MTVEQARKRYLKNDYFDADEEAEVAAILARDASERAFSPYKSIGEWVIYRRPRHRQQADRDEPPNLELGQVWLVIGKTASPGQHSERG